MQNFGLVSFGEILSGVDNDHVQVPEGTAVSTQGEHYVQYKEGHADQRSSHLADYILYIGQFLLDLASLKTLLAVSILWGCERQIFN